MTVTHDVPFAETLLGAAARGNPLPFWLDRPCPAWCLMAGSHRDEDYADRVHMGGSHVIELALEPGLALEEGGPVIESAHLTVGLWQHYRERDPHVFVIINGDEVINFEPGEATDASRLLASPPGEWGQVTLTMMDPDTVKPVASAAASSFTRPPVLAVRQELDTVTVFCPARLHDNRSAMRYLALTPGEAAGLARSLLAFACEATARYLGQVTA